MAAGVAKTWTPSRRSSFKRGKSLGCNRVTTATLGDLLFEEPSLLQQSLLGSAQVGDHLVQHIQGAQQALQHDAVDGIVLAVEQVGLDLPVALAEAVDAPLIA